VARPGNIGHNPGVGGVSFYSRRVPMMHLRSAAVAVIAMLAGSGAVRAQDQELMKKNLEKKLDAEFLKNASWITDFDKAKEEAKKTKKLIFAYFTRSYAN